LLADVLVPFVLAVFLSLLLNPLVDAQVKRLNWPRPVAVGVTFLIGAVVLLATILAMIPVVLGTADRLAEYAAGASKEPVEWLVRVLPFELDEETKQELSEQAAGWSWRQAIQFLLPAAGAAGSGLMHLISVGGLVGVFLLFLLLGRGDKPVPPDSLRGQVERRIQGYIFVTFLISATTGLLTGVTLWALGVQLAWVFGVLAFVLNFIPNIGSVIATLAPVPMILFVQDLPLVQQIAAIGIPAMIQFGLGNVIAPKLLGDRLNLSPVAVLLGLILLGVIWGLPGLVLATPLLATVKIAMERVPLLAPIARFLSGGDTTGSTAVKPVTSI
jgi:AI-2 transport protein TqsA